MRWREESNTKNEFVTVRLGLGVTEGGKIVFSKEKFCRTAQLDEVKRAGNVVYEAVVEWRTVPRIRDAIPVVLRPCIKARMEVFWGFLNAVEADGWWKQRIDGLPKIG